MFKSRASVCRVGKLFDSRLLSVVDQMAVSGTSFVSVVFVGRAVGVQALGEYSVLISIIAATLALQTAFLMAPFSIRHHRSDFEEGGAVLVLALALAAAAAAAVLALAYAARAMSLGPEFVRLLLALSAALPFAMLRESARQFALARLRVVTALIFDLIVCVIQFGSLAVFVWADQLSVQAAVGTMALACGLPSAGWFVYIRRRLHVSTRQMSHAVSESWRIGKWLVLAQATIQVQGYVPFWLSGALAGAATTGVYAACMSVVAFANPLLFGVSNVLMPRLATALKNGGDTGLFREALRNAALLGIPICVLGLLLSLFGAPLVGVLFHAREFEGHGHLIVVLSLAVAANSLGLPAASALACLDRTEVVVQTGVVGIVLSALCVAGLMTYWGPLGAGYGLLIGYAYVSLSRWYAFIKSRLNAVLTAGTSVQPGDVRAYPTV